MYLLYLICIEAVRALTVTLKIMNELKLSLKVQISKFKCGGNINHERILHQVGTTDIKLAGIVYINDSSKLDACSRNRTHDSNSDVFWYNAEQLRIYTCAIASRPQMIYYLLKCLPVNVDVNGQ